MKKLIAIAIGVALAGVGTVALAGRDSSGTMTFNSVAGGYPFQAGVISRSAMNAHFAELASEITDSASRSGKGGFTAPVRGADGTAAAPAFSFTGDTNTGVYRIGTDNIGISVGGTKTVDIASGAVSFVGSTTTTGIARFQGGVSGSTTFNDPVTFVSSVVVPEPMAVTDVTTKTYVDAQHPVATASASSGTFSTSSTTYVDVTNLAVTLTAHGRPVMLMLQPDSSAAGIITVTSTGGGGGGYANIRFTRDGSAVSIANLGSTNVSTTNFFTPTLSIVDLAAPGSHTYKVQAEVVTGTPSMQIYNCVLYAFEL